MNAIAVKEEMTEEKAVIITKIAEMENQIEKARLQNAHVGAGVLQNTKLHYRG